MITCYVCSTEFETYPHHKNRCRPCYNAKQRVVMLAKYHRRREDFIASRGGKCETCGSVDKLEIDHIDWKTKTIALNRALSGWAEARIQAELTMCQVLCRVCHEEKTRQDNAEQFGNNTHWQHGTLVGYRHCHCDLCRAANAKASAERRAKIK